MCRVSSKNDNKRLFRFSLGQFPTGVAVVTCYDDAHGPVGMTINSFSSVSLTPRLISWCIDKTASSYSVFKRCKEFTITVLSREQQSLAQRFATKGANKFVDIPYIKDIAPVIPEGSAWFQCITYKTISLGDHLMMIGLVIDFEQNSHAPLVFAQGQFTKLSESNAVAA